MSSYRSAVSSGPYQSYSLCRLSLSGVAPLSFLAQTITAVVAWTAAAIAINNTSLAQDSIHNWYEDSFIHAHISIGFSKAWRNDFETQVISVQPDVIEFHTPTAAGWSHASIAKELSRQFNFRHALTINWAGTWRSGYDDDPRFVYRINADGSRAGRWGRKHLCCNAPAVDEVVLPYYAKAAREFQPAQIWIDENVITINVCYCEHCRKSFNQQYNIVPPVVPSDPNWQEWITFHRESFTGWMEKVHRAVVRESPHTLVTFNHAYCVEQPEKPPDFIANLSADLHRDPVAIGLYARYGNGARLPFDIMPGLSSDKWAGVIPKTAQQVKGEIAIITSNGGRWNIGEFPTSSLGSNRPIDRYHELALEGANFARARKPWTHKVRSIPYAAILHSASTQYDKVIPGDTHFRESEDDFVPTSDGTMVRNSLSEAKTRIYWPDNHPVPDDILGAHMALLECHIHHDVIHEDAVCEFLDQYRLLIIAEQHKLRADTLEKIEEFVSNGGKVIAVGSSVLAGLDEVIGCQPVEEAVLSKATIGLSGLNELESASYYHLEPTTAEVIRKFDSPASAPAVTLNRYGNGMVAYVASDLFFLYYRRSPLARNPTGNADFIRDAVKKLIDRVWPDQEILVAAPPWIELVANTNTSSTLFHLVDRSFHWKGDIHESANPIQIKYACSKKPASVRLQPADEAISWIWEEGWLSLEVPQEQVDVHAIVVVRPK